MTFKMFIPFNPVITLSDVCPKEIIIKIHVQKYLHSVMVAKNL